MLTVLCPLCKKIVNKSSDYGWYFCLNSFCSNFEKPIKTIDIAYKSKGFEKALSNLYNYPFKFQGVKCSSIESFIRSLVEPDPVMQIAICKLQGINANAIKEALLDWREEQILYWKDKPYKRNSDSYANLMFSAFEEMYKQNKLFKLILERTKGSILIHSMGKNDLAETLLTEKEYISILYKLRDNV